MTPSQILYRCGGRRFVMAASTGAMSTLLLWYGKLDPASFRDIIIGVVAVYVAGNTWQKVKAPGGGDGE